MEWRGQSTERRRTIRIKSSDKGIGAENEEIERRMYALGYV